MRKSKTYSKTKFAPNVIRGAFDLFKNSLDESVQEALTPYFSVTFINGESWRHDSEAEFFADYRREHSYSSYEKGVEDDYRFAVWFNSEQTEVYIKAQTREHIESVFEVFELAAPQSVITQSEDESSESPVIFIGHGRNQQWRDLKDHLQEKHGHKVQAYEIGARAGHEVRDILGDLLQTSSFAILVLTGEDETADGTLRARQNVIHELGLFQGKLGFSRAIALFEDGTEEFSNIFGINQIRFSKGNIKETYGEILATLRREFNR
jgi:predicted nucleotide-binding protein